MPAERPLFRNASAPAERPMDSRTLDADKALAAIRRVLEDGGSCSVEVDGRRRELIHDPAVDAPLRGWPWPFSMFAPHRVRIIIWEDNLRSGTLTYEKKRREEAIKYFLSGVPARAKVIVTRHRPAGGAS